MSDRFDFVAERLRAQLAANEVMGRSHTNNAAIAAVLRGVWSEAIEEAAAQSKASWKAWSAASPTSGATKAAACALSAIIECEIRELKEPKR